MIKNNCLFLGLMLLLTLACAQNKKTSKSSTSGKNGSPDKVITGDDVLVNQQLDLLEGKRVGLVTNHSAVVGGDHIIDLLDHKDVKITALFGPEHGIRGKANAGAKVENGIDEETGAPIYSLYGKNKKPTAEMLKNVDVLMFDIQDVGARFYTYISTLGYAMQAAAENDIPFIVLDRPNPLGGEKVSGFVLEPGFETFVGLYPIPIAYGLTMGELAKMIKGEKMLDGLDELDLRVVAMQNWSRDMLWPETGLEWIPPSPNIPDFETALIYPGACFFERTTASEGRGTMHPFIQLGSPWIDGEALASRLNSEDLPGLEFEAVSFTPRPIQGMETNPDYNGEKVNGIKYHITDPDAVQPVAAGVHVLMAFCKAAADHGKDDFLSPSVKSLAGTDRLYRMIREGAPASDIIASWQDEVAKFKKMRKKYLLYD